MLVAFVLVPSGDPRLGASFWRPLCVSTCDLPAVGPGHGALRLATWHVAACDLAPVGLCRCKSGCPPNWQKACKSKQDAPAVRCAPEHACDDMTHAWACGRPPSCERKCKCKQDAHAVLYAPCRSFQMGELKTCCVRESNTPQFKMRFTRRMNCEMQLAGNRESFYPDHVCFLAQFFTTQSL